MHGLTGSKLYGGRSGADYTDNQKRFKLFGQAALEALTCLPFSPGEETAVVCNDWHTSLLPVLLKVCHPAKCDALALLWLFSLVASLQAAHWHAKAQI